ncbi:S8 family peptidase [Algoriphagus aquimarinus]|uniref:S8 family peptidase n=1 Tax=Algoriphagus aquimarinus TaxID=237018 RepID=A0A5C7ATX3_9BACT|nr:S8 family peptidase [Algoriphagus aquimarinus]TXE12170.1 S8 family peptidase [Algoriphagus aquimarinus]
MTIPNQLWKKPVLCAGVLLAFLAFSCQQEAESPITGDSMEFVGYKSGDIIPGKYIVTFQPSEINFRKDLSYVATQDAMRKTSSALLAKYRIAEENLTYVYGNSIQGFAVTLSDEQLESISKDPSVKGIEPDRIIALAPPSGKKPGNGGGGGSTSQQTPYGITRVGGGATYSGSKKAYIIDSGIDSSHPDLNVNITAGFNAFSSGRDSDLATDGNGHGTHVSGTIGAINNSIGVIGVAAGVTVVPVKVLDSRGSGSYSGVIAGVDYVTANANSGDVANMSLGGPVSSALDAAVVALGGAGVKVALAAGNESDDANNHSPARANGTNIYTVSAIDSSDRFASFSNYGNPPIDFAAPGVGVLSTVPGGYASYSGTSMASPHVCGLLIWGIPSNGGTAIGDPDGNSDIIAIR